MDVAALDGRAYVKFLAAGAYFLRKYRGVLNDLNVFPVPDGDTGTNMYLTIRQAAIEAGKHAASPLSEVAACAAEGALMGARGNSGVILSQMLRGFAHHMRHRSQIDTFVLATGMREAAVAAKQSLVKPVEGTIISVAEAAAEAAYHESLREPDFYRLLGSVLRSANEALERTPEQLPALKEAGVVDSGGAGFIYLLEGILHFLPDVTVRATAYPRRPIRRHVFSPQQHLGRYTLCTEFILEDAACSGGALREALHERGDSLIVAGAPPTIKVHIHTDDASAVAAIAARHGTLTRLKVDNMEQQHRDLLVETAPYSIVAIVPGAGFEQIVRELGAEVAMIANGNPSVREILLAANGALARDVYLFVNDRNAVLAAREAAERSDRTIHVLPTPDVIAGIAGLLAMRSAAEPPDDTLILEAAGRSRGIRLFFAGKDAGLGGTTVQRGKPAAVADGLLYAGATLAQAATAALHTTGVQSGGLITVYYGGSQKERDAQRMAEDLRSAFPQADVEYYYGGQQNAEFWLSFDE
jgi:DAK2 domain fusion protein YloV